MSKIIVFRNSGHGKGVGDVFISGFHIHLARKTCNLEFKNSLYIIMNSIFGNLFYFLVTKRLIVA